VLVPTESGPEVAECVWAPEHTSEVDFDEQIVVYFTAPHRVDFRSLVSDLARALRARIDLRQVWSRDGAKLSAGWAAVAGSCAVRPS